MIKIVGIPESGKSSNVLTCFFLFMRFSEATSRQNCSRQFGTFPFRGPGITTPTFWPLFAYVPVVKLPGRTPQIIGRCHAPLPPAAPFGPWMRNMLVTQSKWKTTWNMATITSGNNKQLRIFSPP